MADALRHLQPGLPDREVVDSIFRAVHSIKGGAATYGFDQVASFAHVLETLLADLRGQGRHISAEQLDLLRRSSAILRDMLHDVQSGPQANARAAESPQDSAVIRINVGKVDTLKSHIDELVGSHSALRCVAESLTGPGSEHLRDPLVRLERKIRQLQGSCAQLRQIPIGDLFARFPRMAQDLAQQLGKQIELEISGGEVEIDSIMLEKVGNSLIQLLRNSIDHGIEGPAVRLAVGKRATGAVRLHAWTAGNRTFVEVSDDGAGFDRDRLIGKAVENGIVGAESVLSDREAYQLIFAPGVSTTDVATEISGRGVGMDVVRHNIELLGGGIEIFSTPGQGSRFLIDVPALIPHCAGE